MPELKSIIHFPQVDPLVPGLKLLERFFNYQILSNLLSITDICLSRGKRIVFAKRNEKATFHYLCYNSGQMWWHFRKCIGTRQRSLYNFFQEDS